MGTETTETTPSVDDRSANQAAFEQVLPRCRVFTPDKLVAARTDLRRAAIAALGVAAEVNKPENRALFSKLPPEKFDPVLLDLLEPAARAVIFAKADMATAEALASEAKLSAALAQESMVVRARMLKLVEYHLGDEEEPGRIIADIRAGSGYEDLSEDLERLARIYRERGELLSKDPSFYVAEDPESAERLAAKIQAELGIGSTPKQHEQKDILARTWTLLYTTYEQIAQPGRWLLQDRGGAELFVSLLTAGRKPRSRRKAAQAPEA